MQKKYKGLFLVSDLDGTLLTDRGTIPQANIDAIRSFVAGGGRFTVATGRTIESARAFLSHLALTDPAIVMNGSLIYDYANEKVLYSEPLAEQAYAIAAAVLEQMPDIGIEISCGRQLYVINSNDYTERHIRYEALKPIRCPLGEVPARWNKLLFEASPERMADVAKFIDSLPHDAVNLMFSSPIFYEVIPQGATKGDTLKILAGMLGIPLDKTVTIGDYYNDCAFLSVSGFSAAPSNAPRDVQHLADVVVCDHREGALADFIGRIPVQCT